MALFAGDVSTPSGSADGTGAEARFSDPRYVAIDSAGNVYVADNGNGTIRKITPAGVVTTLAGTAGQFGYVNDTDTGAAALFDSPRGIATDIAGNVYVADAGNHAIRKITPEGKVSTFAGSATGVAGNTDDPIGTDASFNWPNGLALSSDGSTLYVADNDNHVIRQIDIVTTAVTTLAGAAGVPDYVDGTGAAARFNSPRGVALASDGSKLFVADSYNHVIRQIDIATKDVTTLAGTAGESGFTNDIGTAARFDFPTGLACDGLKLYVADGDNNVIRQIDIVTAGVTTLAGDTAGGAGYVDAVGTSARFDWPYGVATNSAGNVYVADSDNNLIRKIDINTQAVSTLAGFARYGYLNAAGAAALFDGLNGLATDSAGNVYVAAYEDDTIGKITPDGVVSTLAGTGTAGYLNSAGVLAQFNGPWSIAADSEGNVYVSDYYNNAIRKIDTSGVVSTFAGSVDGLAGSTDGTGPEASFTLPEYLATDSAGNVYVSDGGNNTIRKITPDGVVTTLAGTAGQNGFTPGALPGVLANPEGIAVFGTTLYFTSNNGVVSITNLP